MKNSNKNFFCRFDNLELSNDTTKEIKNNVYKMYKKHQKNKKIFISVISIFVIFFGSLGVVYADEIKEVISSFVYQIKTIVKDNGKEETAVKYETGNKTINYDTNIERTKCEGLEILNVREYTGNEKCSNLYTHSEIEKVLGVKLLKSSLAKQDMVNINNVRRNKAGKITSIIMSEANIYKNHFSNGKTSHDVPTIDMQIRIVTKYLDRNQPNIINSLDKDDVQEYEVKQLGVKAFSYKFGRVAVILVYDDVLYEFRVSAKTNSDYTKIIQELLDSLSY